MVQFIHVPNNVIIIDDKSFDFVQKCICLFVVVGSRKMRKKHMEAVVRLVYKLIGDGKLCLLVFV